MSLTQKLGVLAAASMVVGSTLSYSIQSAYAYTNCSHVQSQFIRNIPQWVYDRGHGIYPATSKEQADDVMRCLKSFEITLKSGNKKKFQTKRLNNTHIEISAYK